MRIRKRQVPFPLSSLSPVPLSDLRSHHDEPLERNLQPSDRVNLSFNGWDKKSCLILKMEDDLRGREKSNDSREGRIFDGETSCEVFAQASSIVQGGRWCEGEKEIPLKKRKGNFEQELVIEKKMKMKTKMNEKCGNKTELGVQQQKETIKKRKGKRGDGEIMEGSRCSRVNGRGWRCCQQTLVGYSLCEHHLGKGRLRSMTSVRNRAKTPLMNSSSSFEVLPLMETKKRVKIGMVKARSMSSLLGQTNNGVSITHNKE